MVYVELEKYHQLKGSVHVSDVYNNNNDDDDNNNNNNNDYILFIGTVSDPASGLFQRYSVRLSVVSISEESVNLLCTERLISNETRTQVETAGGFLLGDSLKEIRTSITEDHNKLRSLGDILLKSDETMTIGQDILKECGNTHTHSVLGSIVSIFIYFQMNCFLNLMIHQLLSVHQYLHQLLIMILQ